MKTQQTKINKNVNKKQAKSVKNTRKRKRKTPHPKSLPERVKNWPKKYSFILPPSHKRPQRSHQRPLFDAIVQSVTWPPLGLSALRRAAASSPYPRCLKVDSWPHHRYTCPLRSSTSRIRSLPSWSSSRSIRPTVNDECNGRRGVSGWGFLRGVPGSPPPFAFADERTLTEYMIGGCSFHFFTCKR